MANGNVTVPRTETGIAVDKGMDGGTEANVRAYGSTVTDNSSHVDEYSFSAQDKKDYGIGDHEEVVYGARNAVMPRRFEQLRRKYGEARVAKHAVTGVDPCDHMDVQAIIIPKAARQELDNRRKEAASAHLAKFKSDGRGNQVLREELFQQDDYNVMRRREINAERLASLGVGSNSETAGMGLEEGLAHLKRTKGDIERLGDIARQQGLHRDDNAEQWKTSFSVGADFAPKVTPKSALGQIQQRNAGRAK